MFHFIAQVQGQPSNMTQQSQQSLPQQPMTNGHIPSLMNESSANAIASGPDPTQPSPPTSQTPVSFTGDQIGALCAQIHAFKLISRGLPVLEQVQ
jgi:ATP-dependent helicase STH1/SNF2